MNAITHPSFPLGPVSPSTGRGRIQVALATESERRMIYEVRHEIYAAEMAQHTRNDRGWLNDSLDEFNTYITATVGNELAGFISVTPPAGGAYSIDKYLQRSQLPFDFDDKLYEVRILTVRKPHRGRQLAALLMYAAFRWIEAGTSSTRTCWAPGFHPPPG